MKAIDGRVIHTFHTEGLVAVMRLTSLKRHVSKRIASFNQPDSSVYKKHY
ncbi:MAG: hypothetical protein ACLR5Y_03915 [Haemophilus parainfluenzae]